MFTFHQLIGLTSAHWNLRAELERATNWEEICDDLNVLPIRTRVSPVAPARDFWDDEVDLSRVTNEPVIEPSAHSFIIPNSEQDPYKRRSRPIPLTGSSYIRPYLQEERYEDVFHNPANVKKYGTLSRMEAVARDPDVLRKDPKAFTKVLPEEGYGAFENYWPLLVQGSNKGN